MEDDPLRFRNSAMETARAVLQGRGRPMAEIAAAGCDGKPAIAVGVGEVWWSLTRGLVLPADPAAGYVLACPGVTSYGKEGLNGATVHSGGCCDVFASWPETAQEQTGLRIPKAHLAPGILAALEQERQQDQDAAMDMLHGGIERED